MLDNLNFLNKYNNIDEFQSKSFEIINNFNIEPKNLLVCAPTGSGKSLIAEYAIYHTVKIKNKKVIFTSPIKALSNQKFNDFNNKFKEFEISIGILTGDNKFVPNADCIILTTEILLNELKRNLSKSNITANNFELNIEEIGAIIFDEVHYINDIDRGSVWEESIMNIPQNIQIIMLSATLSKPDYFGNWISNIQNKPTEIILTNNRVVPLNFNIYYSANLKHIPKDKQDIIELNKCIKIYDTVDKKFDSILYNKIIKYHNYYSKLINYNYNYLNIINSMLLNFNNNNTNLYPILFFVLSKKKCYQIAKSINIIYNNSQEQNEVINFIKNKIKLMNCYYLENSIQFNIIKELAIKGIGIHHSGLMPIIKEIIELLYEAKLIKILFATETFAVGLNMPTKTVIFSDIYKFNRLLYSHEFIQMAGRAGRRNIDTEGYVILLPQLFKDDTSSNDIKILLEGRGQSIQSKLIIDETYILRLLDIISKSEDKINVDKLIEYTKSSLLHNEDKHQLEHYNNLLEILKPEYIELSNEDLNNFNKYNNYIISNNNYVKLSKLQKEEYLKFTKDTEFIKKYNIKYNYEKTLKLFNELNSKLDININNVIKQLNIYNMINDINDNISITNRGIIASYILHPNSIIITDIITDIDFNKLSSIDIINILATVIFDEYKEDKIYFNIFKNKYKYIWIDIIDRLYDKYNKLNFNEILDIFNFDYIELLDNFLNTSEYNTNMNDRDYLYEGNFIRMVNRLLNILMQIKYITEITRNIDLMNNINEAINIINNNEWLKPNSIYIKMCSN